MAKVNVTEIEKEKVIKVKEKVYVLELTEKEAQVIAQLTGNVLGDYVCSARKCTDNIYDCLIEALERSDKTLYDSNRDFSDIKINYSKDPSFFEEE